MNILQKKLGSVFPPYRLKIIRKEEEKIFKAIINALPDVLLEIKLQTQNSTFWGFGDWKLHPDFKFITMSYGEKIIINIKKEEKILNFLALKYFQN